jgi:hypothetical protein
MFPSFLTGAKNGPFFAVCVNAALKNGATQSKAYLKNICSAMYVYMYVGGNWVLRLSNGFLITDCRNVNKNIDIFNALL